MTNRYSAAIVLYRFYIFLLVFSFSLLYSCKENGNSNSGRDIKVVAHRGMWREFPENSIEGIQKCIEMGVDMVELDVAMTKDSILILMHDNTLERTTTGTGKVSEHTYDEIKALNLKDFKGGVTDFKVPTLAKSMLLAKDKIEVFIDKGYPYLKEANTILIKTNTQDQACFLVFVGASTLKANYSSISDQIDYMPLVTQSDSTGAFINSFKDFGTTYFLFSFDTTEKKLMDRIEDLPTGAMAMATTQEAYYCGGYSDTLSLNNPDEGWGYLVDKGFTAICTDYPKELLRYLRQRKLHE